MQLPGHIREVEILHIDPSEWPGNFNPEKQQIVLARGHAYAVDVNGNLLEMPRGDDNNYVSRAMLAGHLGGEPDEQQVVDLAQRTATTIRETFDVFSPLLETDQAHPEFGISWNGCPDDLPAKVDNADMRSLSGKKTRFLPGCLENFIGKSDISRGHRCHRVPNEILMSAYNSTEDMNLKKSIVEFSFSKFNAEFGRNNKDHSKMEKLFKNPRATTKFPNWGTRKSDQMNVSLGRLRDDGGNLYHHKLLPHILTTMRNFKNSRGETTVYRDYANGQYANAWS